MRRWRFRPDNAGRDGAADRQDPRGPALRVRRRRPVGRDRLERWRRPWARLGREPPGPPAGAGSDPARAARGRGVRSRGRGARAAVGARRGGLPRLRALRPAGDPPDPRRRPRGRSRRLADAATPTGGRRGEHRALAYRERLWGRCRCTVVV